MMSGKRVWSRPYLGASTDVNDIFCRARRTTLSHTRTRHLVKNTQGPIAQLGEQALCKREVVGSIPTRSTMQLIEVQAPEAVPRLHTRPLWFLAGGITGCPDWQRELLEKTQDVPWIALNPRRRVWDVQDSEVERQQIEWEFRALTAADIISFWFPEETLCPITLYELGRWAHSDRWLIVGTHPQYARRRDVEIQLALARPEIQVLKSLPEMAFAVQCLSLAQERASYAEEGTTLAGGSTEECAGLI